MNMVQFARGCLEDSFRWFGFSAPNHTWHPWYNRPPRGFKESIIHMGLGVAGEAGEVAEAIKKYDRGSITEEQLKAKMEEELTDVLIYLGNIAGLLDIDLEVSYNIKREFNEKRFGHGNS